MGEIKDAFDRLSSQVRFPNIMDPIIVARICHEANRAYCQALDDDSQKPWEQAEQWQRDSAINGVQFLLEHPEAGPSTCHENWMAEKARDGWVYGDVKDPEKKTHPCMVSYEKLPLAQRRKDALFVGIVRSLCPGHVATTG